MSQVIRTLFGGVSDTRQVTFSELEAVLDNLLHIRAVTGTTYTFVIEDANVWLRLADAAPVTVTVPANSVCPFQIGTQITIEQTGTGSVTIAPGSGVTINHNAASLGLAGQYAVATLVKVALNEWTAVGRLA